MPAKVVPQDIQERLGRVRLYIGDLRDIEAALSYKPDRPPIITTGDREATSVDDLLELPDATVPELSIRTPFGVYLYVNRSSSLLMCTGPTEADQQAAQIVRQVVSRRRLPALFGMPLTLFMPLLVFALFCGVVATALVAWLADGWDVVGYQSLSLPLFLGLGLAAGWIALRVPLPDPIILHPDRAENWLRRHVLEITLAISLAGLVVAILTLLNAE